MPNYALSEHELLLFILQLSVLITLARTLGEGFKLLRQPPIVGELLGGVLLGPSILGTLSPELFASLFPPAETQWKLLNGITWLSALLLLLVAGMEVDLRVVRRVGRAAVSTGICGVAVPFLLGLLLGYLISDHLLPNPASRNIFALFLATALSISAIPVIARILMDLNLLKTDVGLIILSAGMFNDLIGWIILSVILGALGGQAHFWAATGERLLYIGLFYLFCLTIGPRLIHFFLDRAERMIPGPMTLLSCCIALALICGSLTQAMGIHVIFGSFMAGIMAGQSPRLSQFTRETILNFILAVFAPIFFASAGLKVNLFGASQHLGTLALVLLIACLGKLVGAGMGALLGGMNRRESLSVGIGMNARGAMEIIIATVGLQAGVISPEIYAMLVIMAMVTSLMAGPLLQYSLGIQKTMGPLDLLKQGGILLHLRSSDKEGAIGELVAWLGGKGRLSDPQQILQQTLNREGIWSTGIGHGVAMPHCHASEPQEAVIAMGRSFPGIDFDAPDGQPVHLVFLIITPEDDAGLQLKVSAELSRYLLQEGFRQELRMASNEKEVLAAFKKVQRRLIRLPRRLALRSRRLQAKP
ncbi:MAG: cation:proton antiporter [Candidatus Tectomicrobia bacterium]|uniref:Cation:proton antiporter n=1 Tax=Tectimicrobiota bacterium TaxID=2528274 RepID=A0A932CNY1_UNCTE|nr:cation:proton antiporter [Candidatus Tectomicrobia bacterium]